VWSDIDKDKEQNNSNSEREHYCEVDEYEEKLWKNVSMDHPHSLIRNAIDKLREQVNSLDIYDGMNILKRPPIFAWAQNEIVSKEQDKSGTVKQNLLSVIVNLEQIDTNKEIDKILK